MPASHLAKTAFDGGRGFGAIVSDEFNLTNGTSLVVTQYSGFPNSQGALEIDFAQNLAAGLNFSSTTNAPDKVALYEVSDFATPLLIGEYPFPTNQQPNANFIGKTVFAGDRIFAVNGNNGIVAFDLVFPSGPALNISLVGSDAHLSWPDGSYILQSSTNLSPTNLVGHLDHRTNQRGGKCVEWK